ncbi:MAG: YqiJ family protein [Pseudomonadota bacterium]
MLEFLGAPGNVVFVAAIVLMVLVGVVQAVGLGGDVDVDADADLDALSWLGVGRVPMMVLLVVFLAAFGLIGLVGQQLILGATGALLSPLVAIPTAGVAALPVTSVLARGLGRILPRDFTTAIDIDDLAGSAAVIVTGRATRGSPARARVEDRHGQPHYVMAEPDMPDAMFVEGERILLVRREGDVFRAISRGDHHLPHLGGLE